MLNYPSINVGSNQVRGSREAITAEAQNYPAEPNYAPQSSGSLFFSKGALNGNGEYDCQWQLDDITDAEYVRLERRVGVDWLEVTTKTVPDTYLLSVPSDSEDIRQVSGNIKGENVGQAAPFN